MRILYIIFLLLCEININAQSYEYPTKNIYFYEFNLMDAGFSVYGYSDKDVPIYANGDDADSYFNKIYTILDCCFDEYFGLNRLPQQILSYEERIKEQLRISEMYDSEKVNKYKRIITLVNGEQISVSKRKMKCRVYSYDKPSYGATNLYFQRYFKANPQRWHVMFDIQRMTVCKNIMFDNNTSRDKKEKYKIDYKKIRISDSYLNVLYTLQLHDKCKATKKRRLTLKSSILQDNKFWKNDPKDTIYSICRWNKQNDSYSETIIGTRYLYKLNYYYNKLNHMELVNLYVYNKEFPYDPMTELVKKWDVDVFNTYKQLNDESNEFIFAKRIYKSSAQKIIYENYSFYDLLPKELYAKYNDVLDELDEPIEPIYKEEMCPIRVIL